VLLCVLWVRSFSWVETIRLPSNFQIGSIPGALLIGKLAADQYQPSHYHVDVVEWQAILERVGTPLSGLPSPFIGGWVRRNGVTQLFFPFWLLVAPTAFAAVAPWLQLRFSLRTLLIATTLVAVGLGLIVWLR